MSKVLDANGQRGKISHPGSTESTFVLDRLRATGEGGDPIDVEGGVNILLASVMDKSFETG